MEYENKIMASMNLICRACMNTGAMVSLFSEDDSVPFAHKIMALAAVQVSHNENLPTLLCHSCVDKLNVAYQFKMLCESTEIKLRGYLSTTTFEDVKHCSIYDDNWPHRATVVVDDTITYAHNAIVNEPTNTADEDKTDYMPMHEIKQETVMSVDQNANKQSRTELRTKRKSHKCAIKSSQKRKLVRRVKSHRNRVQSDIEHVRKMKSVFSSEDELPVEEMLLIKPKQKKKRRLTKYMCETCGSVFNDKSSLRIHNRYHTGERPFVCNICSKGFAVEINLKTHIRCHSGEKPYVCDICGRGFSVAASLRGHMRTHTGERPYACSTCEKTFAQRSNLRTHMRIHTGDKPHKCSLCGKAFCTTSDLNQHNRSHTGERPYACHLCSKRFSMASNLTIHIRIHSGEKNYRCDTCFKTFICKASLNSHSRVHSGVKAYVCAVCEKRFAHSNTLSAHMVVHTGTRNFECDICNKKFARSSSLSAHKKKHKL